MRGVRVAVGLAVMLALDCGPELRTCDKGCVNGAVCDARFNVCVYPRADGGTSGGAAGGATAGGGAAGGASGGMSTCVPACPASMECVGMTCAPRYASLTLGAPARAGASPVTITAQLTTAAGRTAADPAQLVLSVDGGVLRDDAGTAVTVLQRVGAGAYQAIGAFPAMNGPRQLFATFVDAGLSATATTTVDVTPPAPVIELSPPPARTNPNDGGLVTLDTAAPNAFRRDESVTVTIDFPERDVAGVFVDLFSDGGGLQAMGAPDAGCTSRFDGGVCQQARVDLWRHPMRAYHDVVGLSVRATDDVGNGTTVDGGRASVTRFKWRREASSSTTARKFDHPSGVEEP